METKNKWILGLFILGLIGYGFFLFYYFPMQRSKEERYRIDQLDAKTHHIESVYDYQSLYMGDVSNLGALYGHLPLSNIAKKFELDSENKICTIYYKQKGSVIGADTVKRDTVYNAIASFCLISNLNKVKYEFKDVTYTFDRTQMESVLGNLDRTLLAEKTWKQKIQNQIGEETFLKQFINQ